MVATICCAIVGCRFAELYDLRACSFGSPPVEPLICRLLPHQVLLAHKILASCAAVLQTLRGGCDGALRNALTTLVRAAAHNGCTSRCLQAVREWSIPTLTVSIAATCRSAFHATHVILDNEPAPMLRTLAWG